jgi:methionyl aminopeptidase
MYKAFGKFVNNYENLRGINPIFNKTVIPSVYPEDNDILGSLECSATIHKEVRRFLQPYLRPGTKLTDIAKIIELKTDELNKNIKESKPINRGIGFPVGLALNECAAHYHPESSETRALNKNDILKVDFGTEVNGWIIDSAFTIYFNSKYDNLAIAVKEATETGIKNIGIDVDIGDWGSKIQEVMESYEITLNNKDIPIKAITNLGGHNITKGIIHGGMFLPTVNIKDKLPPNYRFKEGVYAVETFGSTGSDIVKEVGDCTLYRINPNNNKTNDLKLSNTKKLVYDIKNTFSTLPFTNRYIENFSWIQNQGSIYKTHLNILSNNNIIHCYPPLCVEKGALTAQYEHTIYLGEEQKVVLSKGEDY